MPVKTEKWNPDVSVRYIEDIQLPQRSRVFGLLSAAQREAGQSDLAQAGSYVNDGMIISVSEKLSGEEARYVQDCTLLASLAAKKKFDRFATPDDWYATYFDVLTSCGWFGTRSGFQEYKAKGSTLIVNEAVLEVLGGVLSQNALLAIKTSLESLKKLADSDGRIVLWDHASHSTKSGNFQIAGASKGSNDVMLNLGAFHFVTTQDTTKFLWMSFSKSDIAFDYKADNLQLDLNAFDALQQVVKEKVIGFVTDMVKKIDV